MKLVELVKSEDLVKQFAQSVHQSCQVAASCVCEDSREDMAHIPESDVRITEIRQHGAYVYAQVEYGGWHVMASMVVQPHDPSARSLADHLTEMRIGEGAGTPYARSLADHLSEMQRVVVQAGPLVGFSEPGPRLMAHTGCEDGCILSTYFARTKRASYYRGLKQYILGLRGNKMKVAKLIESPKFMAAIADSVRQEVWDAS